jgi:hypothetical protein
VRIEVVKSLNGGVFQGGRAQGQDVCEGSLGRHVSIKKIYIDVLVVS